jgi:hypothetical protein
MGSRLFDFAQSAVWKWTGIFYLGGTNKYSMKKLTFLFFPFTIFAWLPLDPTATNLADVRVGQWPMNLERDIDRRDTSYSLIFRNQQYLDVEVMDTLEFANLGQLRYFGQALNALKKGSNGDIANFSNYSVKRADNRFEGGVWYILRIKWGLTDFQQPEADIMCKTINGLK